MKQEETFAGSLRVNLADWTALGIEVASFFEAREKDITDSPTPPIAG